VIRPIGPFAEIHAFVQPLRGLHRAARREAEPVRGGLLQRRRPERRLRAARARLLLDVRDRERAGAELLQPALDLARAGLGGDAEARVADVGLDLLAVELDEPRAERLRRLRRLDLDGPVFLADERLDLGLAVADQPEGDALHAAGRQARHDLLPEQRRQVEADEVVQRAARLLRVDEVARQLLGVRDRVLDLLLRDLEELGAVHGLAVEHAALLQDLVQVPRDRLALAVRVGREVQRLGLARRALDRVDVPVLVLLLDDVVLHREVARRVDRAFLRDEVPHVAVRREHLEILAEVLLDRLRLRGRLDDDQVAAHYRVASCGRRPPAVAPMSSERAAESRRSVPSKTSHRGAS
jgi:hypothetical protein